MKFDFRRESGQPCGAVEWLNEWESKYPSEEYDEKHYDDLIGRAGALSSDDFILIGRWKDSAWTENKWRPNVAMVAFPAWIDASKELPSFNLETVSPEAFLRRWSDRLYPDTSSRSADGKTRLGLSRATTLLHFMSVGKFPICDSRVRTAIKRLCNERAPDDVEWYLRSYIPIFDELASRCGAIPRTLDKAMFAYGARRSP